MATGDKLGAVMQSDIGASGAGGVANHDATQAALDTKMPVIGKGVNLLDNWYFVGGGSQQGGGQFPINQRAGYVVLPGVQYRTTDATYEDPPAGTTNSTYRVNRIGSYGEGFITINNVEYWVEPTDVTPGYSGAGYGIDRYYIESGGSLTIHDGYCSFSGTSVQGCEDAIADSLAGKTVTISALTYEGSLVSKTGKVNPKNQDTFISADLNNYNGYVGLYFFANAHSYQMCRLYGGVNSTVNIVAVKLELGDTQTLAHQENGVWVPNEIPKYGDELLECQRYYQLYATQALRPSNAQDCRPVMRITPTQGTIVIDGITYYYNDANL